jgi:hypothetical protein
MVEKMAGPNGRSAHMLSQEVGVAQPTLSRWLREAGASRVPPVSKKKSKRRRSSNEAGVNRRPQDWKPAEKLQVVLEAAALTDAELGEFLRRKGLHEAQLEEWRRLATEALGNSQRQSRKPSAEEARIRELEKELRRKDKALAEAAALLVLQKKARAIWGDGGDDTDPKSGG